MTATATLDFEVVDQVGHVRRRARRVPKDATVSELVTNFARDLALAEIDADGHPVLYGARSSRGDVLNGSDRLGDVIEQDEVVTLTRSVTAG